jgi:hypothetical protein
MIITFKKSVENGKVIVIATSEYEGKTLNKKCSYDSSIPGQRECFRDAKLLLEFHAKKYFGIQDK